LLFRRPKFWILGIPEVPPPKWEKTRPGRMCTIMQNFTTVVAEISVVTQKELINDKTHTSVAFTGYKLGRQCKLQQQL